MILFHCAHPAHYQMFKNVVRDLSASHDVCLSYNDKDILHELISSDEFNFPVFRLQVDQNRGPIRRFFDKQLFIFRLVRKLKPRLVIGTTIAIAHASWMTSCKSLIVNEDDYEAIKKTGRIGYPFVDKLMSPKGCSMGPFEVKTIHYNGYHELAYLHPNHFIANALVIEKAGLSKKGYIVMRFSALNAHHDTGVRGIDDAFALKIIQAIGDKYQVIITSERPLASSLEPYRMKFHPKEMHHVLAFAKAFIGDSQTMAAEAMVLGTPSIRCNSFVGRLAYLEELENHYQLGVGVLPESREEIIDAIGLWLNQEDLEQMWQERRNAMLKDKIDVAAYWTELFIELAKA